MIKQMTEQDITELGAACGIEFSATECDLMAAHIQKQLYSFEALSDIDTDGVQPTFDLTGNGRFKMKRWGE